MAELSAEIAEARERIKRLEQDRQEAREQFERLKRRKVVQVALAAASPVAAFRRALGRLAERLSGLVPRQRTLARRLRAARAPSVTTGPLVSIIVPTRNGAEHLRRLFDGLAERTDYRSAELVVVDNGSDDETAMVVDTFEAYPVVTVRNEENRSFSEACNQGAAAAHGELLLFLNNDVDPISPAWLGSMVEAMERDSVVAVGALLIYPDGRTTSAADQAPLTVQHRGIAIAWKDGAPRPVNLGTGEEPLAVPIERIDVPAATAACLLVRRTTFEDVGGFDDRYRYGWEDTDLCMRLRETGGTIVVDTAATLFHHEFGTQDLLGAETRTANYANNSRTFAERWAPALTRLRHLDLLDRRGWWAAAPTGTVAITVTDPEESAGYGDWYTAHELGAALEELGWTTRYIARRDDAWHDPAIEADIVVALLPQYDPRRAPQGALTVAWVRNWVERWLVNRGFADFTMVAASTAGFVRAIELGSNHSPVLMPLATNPDTFSGDPGSARQGAVITASAWGEDRSLAAALAGADFPLTVYGLGWESSPLADRWSGRVPYDRLAEIYRGAAVVVDDTVEPNVPAVNGRVFDALAAGALVITDNPAGSEEWFDGLLPTWSEPDELQTLTKRFLAEPEERRALVGRLRAIVLERHTYSRRAEQLLADLRAIVERPSVAIRISPPTWHVADRWGDTHFAADLARAMRRLGYRTRLSVREESEEMSHHGHDVVLALRGLHRYRPRDGAINVAWIISHPDDVDAEELTEFDLVFAAGQGIVDRLATEGVESELLLQATAPERFHPGPADDELQTEVLFVGNARGVERTAVRLTVAQGLPLAVYGQDWENRLPSGVVRADHAPPDLVPRLYRSARVVLNDHWPDMVAAGIISNRIFDVLASGTALVTDPVSGLDDLFDEGAFVFSGPDDFGDAVERARRADRDTLAALARTVSDQHGFDQRARRIHHRLSSLHARHRLGAPRVIR